MKKLNGLLIIIAFLAVVIAVPSMAGDVSSLSGIKYKGVLNIPSFPPGDSSGNILYSQADKNDQVEDIIEEEEDTDYLEDDLEYEIADPLEPLNRFFFEFNDRLYFWILKPVAKGYSKIIPEKVRISVRNAFTNISTPVRVVNNILQGKIESAGDELIRFGVNSTVGILGLFDYAKSEMDMPMREEDFGQTLGTWGAGSGFYINWPVMGPSTLRDSIGNAGDYFLEPLNYINPLIDRYAVKIGDSVNRASLTIGDYEQIKKDALDPYTAIRDIYIQYRKSKIDR